MKLNRMIRPTSTRFFLAGLLFLLALTAVTFQPASAQAPTPSDDEVNAIAKHLYCPVCENTPLDVCPTVACAPWRQQIRDLLMEGRTEQEIRDYFVARYGDRVLAEPPRYGFNWLVYVLPPVLFLAGAFVVYRVLRGSYRPVQQVEAPPPPPDDDPYLKRLEEELRRREQEGQ